MANYAKIRVRRDTTENWKNSNPVLALGELGADMTLQRMKVGDGVTVWNSLPYVNGELFRHVEALIRLIGGLSGNGTLKDPVDKPGDLPAKYPSPTKGDIVFVKSENKFYIWDGSKWTPMTIPQGGVDVGTVNRLIDDKIKHFGTFGMGYTVNEFNAYKKPTKITFSDGLVATLTWSGSRLDKIVGNNGEEVTFHYDGDGLVTGRTVKRAG